MMHFGNGDKPNAGTSMHHSVDHLITHRKT